MTLDQIRQLIERGVQLMEEEGQKAAAQAVSSFASACSHHRFLWVGDGQARCPNR